MKRTTGTLTTLLIFMGFALLASLVSARYNSQHVIHASPIPAVSAQPAAFPPEYIAALDVARIFGRSTGCAEATPILITTIAQEAIKAGVDPRVLAATIAVESACNQYATSSKGAIGLTQVLPRIWKDTYNFEKDYNLLNPRDSVHVGAAILGSLVKQYGTTNGLRRYNGLGVDCDSCDAGYVDKITALAAKR